MDLILDIVSWVLIVVGVIFCVIGGYGVLTLKDMYSRLHGGSLIETLGIGGVFLGLILQVEFSLVTAKLILILAFVFFTSPTTTHALARAAINHDVLPDVETEEERDMVRATKSNREAAGEAG